MMQFTLLALAAVPLAIAFPIDGANVNCREGPGTSFKVVKQYAKNQEVQLLCQSRGPSVSGDTLWDKTSDNCYVADYYVKTGTSNMVVGACPPTGGGEGGYAIKGDHVNCRKGPGTNFDVVKQYNAGQYVSLTCQQEGEAVSGDKLWDKTTDNCFVADYYVETHTGKMVTGACAGGSAPPPPPPPPPPPSGGHSSPNGPISRQEIIARGQFWMSKHVPYSMSAYYPDPEGVKYRTDCSGFVSMALHTSQSYNTNTIRTVSKEIAWPDLLPGDYVGTLGAPTGGGGGHVTLFVSWTDGSKKRYNSFECMDTKHGCIPYQRDIGWKIGQYVSKPYRYIHVE